MAWDISLDALLNSNVDRWSSALGLSPVESIVSNTGAGGGSWLDYLFSIPRPQKAAPSPSATANRSAAAISSIPSPDLTADLNRAPLGAQAGRTGAGFEKWAPLAKEASAAYDVPFDVIMGIMGIEAPSGDPEVQGAPTKWGRAQSLMQVMPFHWPEGTPEAEMRDPRTNIFKGAEILKRLYDKWGNWDSAAAAYFGAIDANGNPTGAQDANGQTGTGYVKKFQNTRATYKTGW